MASTLTHGGIKRRWSDDDAGSGDEIEDIKFNKAVLANMERIKKGVSETENISDLFAVLLLAIAESSGDELDPSLKNLFAAAEFLNQDEEVPKLLEASWKTKSFVKVRQYGRRFIFQFTSVGGFLFIHPGGRFYRPPP
jgi:hypothetical protein